MGVIFGLSLPVICIAVGLGIDFASAQRTKSVMAIAMDAANLAAAQSAAAISSREPSLSVGDVIERAEGIGKKQFHANIEGEQGLANIDFELQVAESDGHWTAASSYTADLATVFMAVSGLQTLSVAGEAKASIKPSYAALEIAMCIDATGSMTPTIDAVKANAISFYDNLNVELEARGIPPFASVRVRLGYFKDFGDATPGVWDADALETSGFFQLPGESGNFNAFAAPKAAGGGGDWAEAGVVCLNDAMKSDWLKPGDSISGSSFRVTEVYPLLVVWTDAPSHAIDFANSLANPAYPAAGDMPRDYDGFLAQWNDADVIDQRNKQILFFGDPLLDDVAAVDRSAWLTIKEWPDFSVGGTLLEANTSMTSFLADGIALKAKGLAITN